MNAIERSDWRLERDADDLVWLTLDCPDRSVNALSQGVLAQLDATLDALDASKPKGLVIRSGKPTGFIVGADIGEFEALESADQAHRIIERGWRLFERISALRYPTLALIDGHCLGGGLELALACRYRLAVDRPGARLGLPEVMLGIFPGWGGVKRLPRLIGAPEALAMMLSGRTVDPRRAERLGLVDARVPQRIAERAAAQLIRSGRPPARAGHLLRLLESAPLRRLVAAKARRDVEAKDPDRHYPAPRTILELWERHDGDPLIDPTLVGRLFGSAVAANLIRVFHLQERLKGFSRQGDAGDIRDVHVVGAGVMGGDIAAWCALKGFRVTLQDQQIGRIAPAIARAAKLYGRRLKRDHRAIRDAMDRLIPDPDGAGITRADLVIEAIGETLEAKRDLYRALEPRIKPGALLATNTSSLDLAALREGLSEPERLVGIHFFNPVAKMPLVEVIHTGDRASDETRRACAFVGALDKLPLPVLSTPGFLVNAVLAPYLLEAMRVHDEGLAAETIDAAMVAFGMPMGPLELADTVGLDIVRDAGRGLTDGAAVPRCLEQRLAQGQLGKKSGRGFYSWQDGKPAKAKPGDAPDGLALRIIHPLVERTRAQLAAGVVEDADLADAGVIFGTGYAPFSGGPLSDKRLAPSATGAEAKMRHGR
ncbi:3-hydroxyacyl-CoA dehydrogenase NAD-binding domain-containing protein [Halotalea alkalilenta]|uniref:Enoyl-CoA hydratase n=1 Tax=Halotalea alkalilenta TaxID=376489 RepID=A0A172YCL9_9GAMM|nr:3-hydroxyacyl-CoA dehydrogenase NAD-binding domain-containing protein [Halotalea alkalilenta]ANF56973.1 enoyl-CoA hydratase [Halotalea alkalilenta]